MERTGHHRGVVRALAAYSRPVRWWMLVTTLIGLGRIAVSLAFVWASKRLVDIATGHSSMPLGRGIGLFVGILLIQLALVTLFNWWEGY
ncbi:MAG: hypothetical protein IJM35_10160, partial [Bacteroidales bacterium]|nr:hypothetical protein [Bacteroidales bacterium]